MAAATSSGSPYEAGSTSGQAHSTSPFGSETGPLFEAKADSGAIDRTSVEAIDRTSACFGDSEVADSSDMFMSNDMSGNGAFVNNDIGWNDQSTACSDSTSPFSGGFAGAATTMDNGSSPYGAATSGSSSEPILATEPISDAACISMQESVQHEQRLSTQKQQQLMQLNQETETSSCELAELENEVSSIQESNKHCDQQIEQARDKLEEIKKAQAKQKSQKQFELQQASSSEHTFDQLQVDIEEAQLKVDSAASHLDDERTQLKDLRDEQSDADRQLQSLRDELQDLELALEQTEMVSLHVHNPSTAKSSQILISGESD